VFLFQLLEHRGQNVVQGPGADGVVQAVERLGGGLANLREVIAQRSTNRRHQRVDERQDHVLRRGDHDLGQADADALALFRQRRLEAFLQDGNDLRQDSLAQLLDEVTESASSNLFNRNAH